MAVLPGGFNTYTTCLHSDKSNGSTIFLDASGNGKSITAYGAVAHSTDRAKFAGSSIKCLAPSDYLAFGLNYAPGLMIDFYVYLSAWPAETKSLLYGKGSENACFVKISPSGVISFQWFYEPAVKPGLYLEGTLALGEWNHIYVFAGIASDVIAITCGDGSYNWPGYLTATTLTTQLGINGVVKNGSATTASNTCGTLPYEPYLAPVTAYIGNMPCYLDEIRVTCEPAVSGNFTPYTSPYPQTTRYITGTVKKGTAYVSRTVCAYDKSTKALLGTAISDVSTGVYLISNLPSSVIEAYAIALKEGDDLESLILDPVVPVEG